MQRFDLGIIRQEFPAVQDLVYHAPGGQKDVYRGNHRDYGPIVLKIILTSGPDPRTQREIDIVRECDFPHVPKIFEWGTFSYQHEDRFYMIEQYIDGQTLRSYLEVNGSCSVGIALSLLESLLKTTVESERWDVVHRDIKPQNIIVSNDGSFWLLDFGIARHLKKTSLTDTGNRFGPHTLGYAAPEQIRNLKKEIDARTDLFSIGVVIYEAIHGQHPFINGARDRLDVLRRSETLAINCPDIPGDTQRQLAAFINLLMEKYPSRRPRNAQMALDWFNKIRPTVKP